MNDVEIETVQKQRSSEQDDGDRHEEVMHVVNVVVVQCRGAVRSLQVRRLGVHK
jgi:hypothetical protein